MAAPASAVSDQRLKEDGIAQVSSHLSFLELTRGKISKLSPLYFHKKSLKCEF